MRYEAVLTALMATLALVAPLRAEDDQPSPSPSAADADDRVSRARRAFVDGARLAEQMRWGDALERFEASAKLKRHAGTTYNIGICHRALGRYTLAQATFRRALAEHEASGETELAPSLLENTRAYLEEIDRVLASLDVTLSPADATITVDGRPLETVDVDGKPPTLVAGTEPPGAGRKAPSGRFRLVLDPGTHIFVLNAKGHGNVVLRQSVAAGASRHLELKLERLPAELAVRSSEALSAVSLDGIDVGAAPVTLLRPPGRYHVEVRKAGFEPYETDVMLRSAQEVDLLATLNPEEPGIHERWWFWTSIGAAVATAAVVTYFVVKPEPERPPLDGGGLGWAIRVP
ncbi:MAG TPA: PEGA domain-containing protein [Polyangiaceae bacterium]|nr:PEGA domain-containing protein [Polyangiaceae bacterium]